MFPFLKKSHNISNKNRDSYDIIQVLDIITERIPISVTNKQEKRRKFIKFCSNFFFVLAFFQANLLHKDAVDELFGSILLAVFYPIQPKTISFNLRIY